MNEKKRTLASSNLNRCKAGLSNEKMNEKKRTLASSNLNRCKAGLSNEKMNEKKRTLASSNLNRCEAGLSNEEMNEKMNEKKRTLASSNLNRCEAGLLRFLFFPFKHAVCDICSSIEFTSNKRHMLKHRIILEINKMGLEMKSTVLLQTVVWSSCLAKLIEG